MEDETQETQGNQETQTHAPAPEDLGAIRAELEEEREARAAAQASLAEKDDRIAELEASLSEAKQGSEATAVELASIKEAKDQAVAKYLNMAKALNPAIPEGIIAGETTGSRPGHPPEAPFPSRACPPGRRSPLEYSKEVKDKNAKVKNT